jgi:hypothetical protein
MDTGAMSAITAHVRAIRAGRAPGALGQAAFKPIGSGFDPLAPHQLGGLGLKLPEDAYVFSNDPMAPIRGIQTGLRTKASDLATAAGVNLNIKGLRHYTASQLLTARFDLRNTAARLGHGSGGATTLRHYADPVSESTA